MISEAEVQLDQSYSLLLQHLDEPHINCLRVTVVELGESPKEMTMFGEATPIEIQPDSLYFEIEFERYVLYQCINESHGFRSEDLYTGKRFRRYTASKLLDQAANFANLYNIDGDAPIKHFEIIAEHHCLSVLTYIEPIIRIYPSSPREPNIG